MKIRTCNICGATSETKRFYRGVTSRCAECHRRKVSENRKEKADYYRVYDAKRYQEDPRVRARHRAYQKTDAGKSAMKAARDRWESGNTDKRAAHVILMNAVRSGRVDKPCACSACGISGVRIHGHHEDYAKPLDVIWLCQTCHFGLHRVA